MTGSGIDRRAAGRGSLLATTCRPALPSIDQFFIPRFRPIDAAMQPSQLPLVQRRPPRRSFIAGAGAVAGAPVLTLLPGRGSGDDDPDSVWDEGGAATAIVSALGAVSQGAFPARDFAVTSYGAQPCQVVAAVSPYTDASKSPVTTGSDETHVHNSFDSRPAFLTAIQACNAASALYDTTVADRR